MHSLAGLPWAHGCDSMWLRRALVGEAALGPTRLEGTHLSGGTSDAQDARTYTEGWLLVTDFIHCALCSKFLKDANHKDNILA